jgi:hypothetical protein
VVVCIRGGYAGETSPEKKLKTQPNADEQRRRDLRGKLNAYSTGITILGAI